MKKYGLLLLLLTIVTIATVLSGCCCCSVGGANKFQKSVDNIKFPSELKVGGTTYSLVSSKTLSTQDGCVDQFMSNAQEEGYNTDGARDWVSLGAQLTGISEAKEFVYRSANGDKLKGFVGKSGSSGMLSSMCSLGKQVVSGVGDITSGSSPDVGEDSGTYSTVLPNGKRGYATAARDGNMFMFAYTYSSYAASNGAVQSALDAIKDAM